MESNVNYENYYQKIILTLGKSHFVLPIKYYHPSLTLPDNIVVTLADNAKVETNSHNILLVTGESELINAILESPLEHCYKPQKTSQGKVKMKRISIDSQINGGKQNE